MKDVIDGISIDIWISMFDRKPTGDGITER